MHTVKFDQSLYSAVYLGCYLKLLKRECFVHILYGVLTPKSSGIATLIQA